MDTRRNRAVKRWGLNRCEEIYRHPTKAVFSAESEQFGSVILKIDENTSQLKSEYRMLAGLCGSHSCKVYDYDESAGLLLEERIFPGTVLRREPSLEKRVRIFAQVFREIHRPAEEGRHTWTGWSESANTACRTMWRRKWRIWHPRRGDSAGRCSGNIWTGCSSTAICIMTICCCEPTEAMP